MDNRIPSLLATLAGATTFEDAAGAVLEAMLGVAGDGLGTSAYDTAGRILRGMVHLRPADGYRRLWVVENGTDSAQGGNPSCLPSATAWRWVAEHRVAVAIDVKCGVVDIGATGTAATQREESRFASQESQMRLLNRDATHLFVLPLRAPGGSIHGMLSIEAHCRAAIGQVFIFPACHAVLQALANAAAPYLCVLPLRPVQTAPDAYLPVIGPSMAGIVETLRVFAQQEETILLSGPTGVGKSRFARWCHEQSARRGHPFETLVLSTVPEDLQMAELFGWKRGSFTGALKDTPGAIARAQGGTLFVDEIDKLSLKAQAGLLRVLEDRRYRPIGETAGERDATARFVIGTSADLQAEVRAGRFRADLYYRINVLPVKVPPLAARPDEVPAWAAYMLDRRHRDAGAPGYASLAPEAERILSAQLWPGNLRQLDNIVRRAYALMLMRSGELRVEVRDIHQALAYEVEAGQRPVIDLLQAAAAAFVAEAERRRAAGEVLDLDLADAMRGMVLCSAAMKLGNKEEAFRLLGKEALVQNRNQQKTLKRELERVEALCRALGEENPFASLGADDR